MFFSQLSAHNFTSKDQNLLFSNEITGFFGHQYLLKESTNLLEFLPREGQKRMETSEITTFS